MERSETFIRQLTDSRDDIGLAIMRQLREKGLENGISVTTQKGTFNISNARDKKTNRTILKIVVPDRDIIFTQYTINPFLLADILEQVESID